MPVIACKKCPCNLRVRDDSDGDTVRCPNCGHSFKCSIPAESRPTAEEVVTRYVPNDVADAEPRSRTRRDDDITDTARRSKDRDAVPHESRPRRRLPDRDFQESRPFRGSPTGGSGSVRRRRTSSSALRPALIAGIAVTVTSVVIVLLVAVFNGDSRTVTPKNESKPIEEPKRFNLNKEQPRLFPREEPPRLFPKEEPPRLFPREEQPQKGFEPARPFNPERMDPDDSTGFRTTAIMGGRDDPEFRDESPDNGLLVGLEVGIGKFRNSYDIALAVRPVYRTGARQTLGKQWGSNAARVVKAIAKPGYAIGAVTIKTGLGLDGLSVTFMKVVGKRLDPADAYESEWIGGIHGNGPVILAGDGLPVVGIIGKTNRIDDVSGFGLVQRTFGGRK